MQKMDFFFRFWEYLCFFYRLIKPEPFELKKKIDISMCRSEKREAEAGRGTRKRESTHKHTGRIKKLQFVNVTHITLLLLVMMTMIS